MNHIAGVPTSITALTHDCAPQPGTFWLSIAYSTGRSDIGHVHGLDSHGWWLPSALVSPAWNLYAACV